MRGHVVVKQINVCYLSFSNPNRQLFYRYRVSAECWSLIKLLRSGQSFSRIQSAYYENTTAPPPPLSTTPVQQCPVAFPVYLCTFGLAYFKIIKRRHALLYLDHTSEVINSSSPPVPVVITCFLLLILDQLKVANYSRLLQITYQQTQSSKYVVICCWQFFLLLWQRYLSDQ